MSESAPETAAGVVRRVIVAQDLGELWLALVENSTVVELVVRPLTEKRWLGTIFKGRVSSLVPGVAAAFVAAGLERDLFVVRADGDEDTSPLAPGDEVLVQIVREADGDKGHRATPEITLPGWGLILAPGGQHRGVSKKIREPAERQRLRDLIERIAPEGSGVIARTAACGRSEQDLVGELALLEERWQEIHARAERLVAPALVHREDDAIQPFLRDHLSDALEEIIVEGDAPAREVSQVLEREPCCAELSVRAHPGPLPAVEAWRLDRVVESAMRPSVRLSGGGRIVIQHTEALVAIDVNSGRDTSGCDLETTALRTNLDAAKEIARQIRLRGLSGLIVVDFIDMQLPENRQRVSNALTHCFASDRAKVRMLPLTEYCLAQISRQRRRPALERLLGHLCPSCGGGFVPDPGVRARRLLRRLRQTARPLPAARFRVTAPEPVLTHARNIAAEWGAESGLPDGSRILWGEGAPSVEMI